MYKRVLLKLSGEALSDKNNSQGSNFDPAILQKICKQIKDIQTTGIEVAIVVGGGNFIRGKLAEQVGLERVQADYMGMLATAINALALQSTLEQMDVQTRVMSAIDMPKVAEPYIVRRATRHLEKGRVVIFACGTGSPYFSTDTTAALRASEIKADVILMAKNGVDGVYSADPKLDPEAVKYDNLTYMDLIQKQLTVMDTTATSMCMDNEIDLVVFNMNEEGNIFKAAQGNIEGTLIRRNN